jgi:uncharacterized protein YaaQ
MKNSIYSKKKLTVMKNKTWAVLCILVTLFVACDQMVSGGVKGTGSIEKETRDVKDFKGVNLMSSGNVFLKKGTTFSVVVETHKNIAELLETVNDNGTLKIRFKNNIGNIHYDKLNIYVEAPSIETIDLSGSGDIMADNAISNAGLAIDLSGSGRIELKEGGYTQLTANLGGSGSIALSGTAENGVYAITGSGNIDMKNMKAKAVKAEVTGSGNIYCHADAELDAAITGSGNIEYSGDAVVKSRVTGSGSIDKK